MEPVLVEAPPSKSVSHRVLIGAALAGGEVHSTVILSRVDENVFQHLGMNLTCEPKYQTKKLYHGKK